MTRSDLMAWLAERRPAPPPALGARLGAAVADSAEPLAAHLADVGRDLLARVAAAPAGGRELALDLLAADAFVTYAFEAQAEGDAARLVALAERVAGESA